MRIIKSSVLMLLCVMAFIIGPAAAGTLGTIATPPAGNVGINAGSNLIGKVGIDQTTPGTTNAVSLAQIGATTISSGVGAAGAGTPRVTDVASGTTGSAPPAQASFVGGIASGATGGLLGGITVCDSSVAISQMASATLVSGVSGRKFFICAINLVTATAQNINLLSGTGAACVTTQHAIAGGTSAATGWNFSANGGLAQGSGVGVIMQSGTAADDLCLLQSSSGQVSGSIRYAIY